MNPLPGEPLPGEPYLAASRHPTDMNRPARNRPHSRESIVTVHASGTFDVKMENQPAYDSRDGTSLHRASLTKEFQGDFQGTSDAEMLSAMSQVPGSAGYVAVERMIGSLHGRSGSFVLLHKALAAHGEKWIEVSVVPDSGTGELAGLSGTLVIDVVDGKHTYDFDYTLDDQA
jgi:hypothetical protein